jgi:two-component system, LuxR family, sensor kinase FixL
MRQWLTPPVFEDEEKTQRAFMLHVMLWALIFVPVPYVLYVLIQIPANIGRALAQAIFSETVNLFLLFLLKRGHVRPAAIIQMVAFWAFCTASAVTGGGVRGTSYLLGYGLIIIIAGVLLGGRGALVATIGVILSGGVMTLAEIKGWFLPIFLDVPLSTWIISLVVFPVSAVLQNLAARALRQALTRARTSEAQYRLLIDESPLGILIVDRQDRVTLANPAACRMLGYTAAELNRQELRRFMADPETPPLAAAQELAGETIQQERWLMRQDGARVPVLASHKPMPDERRQYIFQDITARKQAQEALKLSEARSRAIVETLPDMLFSFNEDGVFTDFYAPDQQFLLMPPDQFIGQPVSRVLPPFLAELTQHHIRQALASRQIQIYEYTLPLGENVFHYESRMMAVREKEVLAIVRDITARKRAEAERERLIADLEAKNAELERFTYTVSHDLKSPLVTIRGFLGFLEKDAASGNTERLHTDLGRISRAADTMQQLLNDLLELSRIGRLMNPPEEISFEAITRQAVELVRGRIEARHIQVEIAPNLPTVSGDRLRLVEVMQNLLDNACKFMGDQSQPRIEISVSEADGQPVFFVRDNGLGIDPAYHDQIFGLFNKLDPQSEGTGVGLALVKRIIEVYGGRIWVESAGAGQGTAFYFTLPCQTN